jgi:hypothetical protein
VRVFKIFPTKGQEDIFLDYLKTVSKASEKVIALRDFCYGMKYSVSMLSKVSDCLKKKDDFYLVGAASEDMFWILAKRKDFCEKYFANLKIEINLKLHVKNFDFKFGVYDIQDNNEDVYSAFKCAGIALSAAKTEDIKISGYFTEPIVKELAGEPNLEEAFDRGIK